MKQNKAAKTERYFLDENNNFVEPEKATRCVIRGLDENGVLLFETWGTCSPKTEEEIAAEKMSLDEYMASIKDKLK